MQIERCSEEDRSMPEAICRPSGAETVTDLVPSAYALG